jgi:hypothetical protein
MSGRSDVCAICGDDHPADYLRVPPDDPLRTTGRS